MTFKGLRVYLCAIILFISPTLLADPNANFINSELMDEFSLSPLACVTKKQGDSCELIVRVNWRAKESISPCLIQKSKTLKCWKRQSSGNVKLPLTLFEKSKFEFKDKESEQLLASAQVRVSYQQPKHYRRRLRADWSIF